MTEHSLSLANRQNMELSGVTNVITFDEEEIMLATTQGYLAISGKELHISMLNLDQGQVAIQGTVNSLAYKPQGTNIKAKSKSVLNRLLK